MRFLHTADWHLGKQLHGRSLVEDQAHVLEQFHAILADEKPDCVVIAGDIFDRAVPPAEAVQLFDETLHRLALEFGRPVLIISGNHDSEVRLGYAARLLEHAKIFIYGGLDPARCSLALDDAHGAVHFLALPFLEPAAARELLGAQEIASHEDALRGALALCPPRPRSVVVAHAFVQGGFTSESERPLTVGGSDLVSPSVFDSHNYVALGHLHGPQSVGASHIRYAGSLLKYSSSEVSQRKSFSMVTIDERGNASVEEIAVQPKRDFRRLRGRLKDLLNPEYDAGNLDDYFVFELEDEGALLDAMGQLRERYPHALDLKRLCLGHTGDPAYRSAGDHLRRDMLGLFRDFAAQVSTLELNEGHLEVLGSLCVAPDSDGEER